MFKKEDKMRIAFTKGTWVLLALIATVTLTAGYRCRKSTWMASVLAAGKVTPQPLPYPGFPFPATLIDGWVASNNSTAMRAHGWGLWGALGTVTPSTQGLPTYETWYSNGEVQKGPPVRAAVNRFTTLRNAGQAIHDFEVPEQFHHDRARLTAATLSKGSAAIDVHSLGLVTTKFDVNYATSIWANNYQTPSTIWGLQANWGTVTPVSQRIIKPFTAPSVSLKPVYQFVNGPNHNSGLTTVKYWLGDLSTGPANSTDPQFPTPNTWNQCVVVNTGTAPNPGNLTCFGTSTPANGMVPVSRFYNFPLSATEAASTCKALRLPNPCEIQTGDYAILVAMHVSTKENSNWTWQTFWWNYNQPFPYGGPPSSVPAPFNNYAMCTGYSMTTNPPNSSKGTNVLCYNPYLETGLGPTVNGINSDCMSCHSVASIGNNPNSLSGNLSPRNNFGYPTFLSGTTNNISVWNGGDDKVFFDCQTTTDFSWFLANYVAGSTPKNQAPCVLTAVHGPPLPKK